MLATLPKAWTQIIAEEDEMLLERLKYGEDLIAFLGD